MTSDTDDTIAEHEQELTELRAEQGEDDDVSLELPGLPLDRRDFMKAGAVAGALTSTAGCLGTLDGDSKSGAAQGKKGSHSVAPGELDEYYAFLGAGQGAEIRVLGLPSMRELTRIPIFEQDAARGHGHDNRSTEILEQGGDYRWGDAHHPRVSQTDNDYDGRWAFVNDKANGRMARVDLKYFETDAIVDVPNQQGTHGACCLLPDTKYVFGVGELRVPMPNDGRDLGDPEAYTSTLAAIDPETMNVEWEVLVDGNMDNADSGKEGRWFFASGYNSEEATTEPEMTRSDRDMLKAFDVPAIEEAVDAGNYEEIQGVPVVDGTQGSSLNSGDRPIVRYVPVPKNPHGVSVTPDGKYVIASGKLDPTCTIVGVEEIAEVDDPADAIVGRPRVGLGPLHTAYDDRGHAYTSLFIDSQVAKWDIEAAVEAEEGSEDPIVEKIDVHYNPGHVIAAESYTADPTGDYLISLNKLSKDRFLNTGPIKPENDQLIYIGDDEAGMQLIKDKPSYPEPHDASIVAADKIQPADVYDPEDYDPEFVNEGDENIERVDDSTVHIRTYVKRNEYGFSEARVQEGDEVTITATNVETTDDIVHGLAVPEYDINLTLAPQDTREVTFTADKPGVYWVYCTFFCSALHMEMRSRLIVEPSG